MPKFSAYQNLSLTVPRYTNGRASDLNSLQEIIHVSRLSFFTHSLTRSFFVSSLKERNYTYSMYLSTVKVGLDDGTLVLALKKPSAAIVPMLAGAHAVMMQAGIAERVD